MKVFCNDCGNKFEVEVSGGVYDPAACPNCGGTIISVKSTPTSSEKSAQIEE